MIGRLLAFLGIRPVEDRERLKREAEHARAFERALKGFSHRVVQGGVQTFWVQIRCPTSASWVDANVAGLPKGFGRRHNFSEFSEARDHGAAAEEKLKLDVSMEFTRLREYSNIYYPPDYLRVPINSDWSDEVFHIEAAQNIWRKVS